MTTIDRTRRHTQVGGRLPVAFLQDGYAFTVSGDCLGRCDEQGELIDAPDEQAPVEPEPTGPESASESGSGTEPEGPESVTDDTAPEPPLDSLKVPELRERAQAAGIDTTGLKKPELIEALEA